MGVVPVKGSIWTESSISIAYSVYSEGGEGVFEGGGGGGGGGEGRVGVVLFYFFGRKTTPRILSNLRYLIALLRKRRAVPPTRTIKTRQTSTRAAQSAHNL